MQNGHFRLTRSLKKRPNTSPGRGVAGRGRGAATRSNVLVRVIAFVFEIILENQINLPGHTLLADSHEIIYPVGQTHTEIIYFF